MINGKKIVGLCMTRIYDASRAQLIDRLHRRLEAAGMKLIVFNSFVDFYYNDDIDRDAKSVYDLIQFSVVDVLVIHDLSFFQKSIVAELVERAHAAGKPCAPVHALEALAMNLAGFDGTGGFAVSEIRRIVFDTYVR